MKLRTNRLTGLFAIALLALASPALADHGKPEKAGKSGKSSQAASQGAGAESAKTGPSPEQRAKMADAHQRMAECLRSTRPIGECHAEMHKAHEACEKSHGGDCGMGHEGGEHHGHQGGGHAGHEGHGKPATSTPAPSTTTPSGSAAGTTN